MSTSRSRATCWPWSPGLGALFAGILAVPQLREFFDMTMLGAERWFIAMPAALGWSLPA